MAVQYLNHTPECSCRGFLQSISASGAFLLSGLSGESSHSIEFPADLGEPVSDFEVKFVRDAAGELLVSKADESGDPFGLVEYITSREQRDSLT